MEMSQVFRRSVLQQLHLVLDDGPCSQLKALASAYEKTNNTCVDFACPIQVFNIEQCQVSPGLAEGTHSNVITWALRRKRYVKNRVAVLNQLRKALSHHAF